MKKMKKISLSIIIVTLIPCCLGAKDQSLTSSVNNLGELQHTETRLYPEYNHNRNNEEFIKEISNNIQSRLAGDNSIFYGIKKRIHECEMMEKKLQKNIEDLRKNRKLSLETKYANMSSCFQAKDQSAESFTNNLISSETADNSLSSQDNNQIKKISKKKNGLMKRRFVNLIKYLNKNKNAFLVVGGLLTIFIIFKYPSSSLRHEMPSSEIRVEYPS